MGAGTGRFRWGWRLAAGVVLLSVLMGMAVRALAASLDGELSGFIAAEDARLGTSPGAITIDRPGRISTPLRLRRGHTLEVRAAVAWAATVRLESGSAVTCSPGAVITAALPAYQPQSTSGAMLLAEGVQGIRVQGCHVRSAAESLLFEAAAASEVVVSGNVLDGALLGVMLGPQAPDQRLRFERNSVTGPAAGSKHAGLTFDHVQGVVVTGNSFTRLIHGAMWWGGDSAAAGMGPRQVTTTGGMTFSENTCKDIAGACIWGSMGHDITISGNVADGCGDVCFDTEGGVRTQMTGNTATRCGNGCAGIFFFTDETRITGNHFRAQVPGGGLIFIKNSSRDPARHDHLRIEKNELRCEPKGCRAVYQEAAGGIRFIANEVTDGVWLPLAYARSVVIADNHFVFRQAIAGVPAAIWTPGLIGGTALEVTGNRVESHAPQPAGTACVMAGWTDYNATDYHVIAGNTCGGMSPFPVGIRVTSAGTNLGVAGVWVLSANQLRDAPVEHAPKPNERFFDLGECGTSGCRPDSRAIDAARAQPGCVGAAPAAAAGSVAVCLGPVRGWGTVPISR